jgi:hypothetical protein
MMTLIFSPKVVMHSNHEMDKFKSSKEDAPKMTLGLLKFILTIQLNDFNFDYVMYHFNSIIIINYFIFLYYRINLVTNASCTK